MQDGIQPMRKPEMLRAGDTVATVSLSGGAAGEADLRAWYQVAKDRLRSIFGLNVVETKHCLMGREYVYQNPAARADDLMEALLDDGVKAVLLCQGGDDAARILPYIDRAIIRDHPKVFLGFSDATIIHHIFLQQNIVSFYGPNVLTTLSEPVALHPYTVDGMRKALFSRKPIGSVQPAGIRVYEPVNWKDGLHRQRPAVSVGSYEVLQGSGRVQGCLLGGCLGPLIYMLKGTDLFPAAERWEGSILFIDGMLPYGSRSALLHMLRGLAACGVLSRIRGMVVSNPFAPEEEEATKGAVLTALREEGLQELPVLYNVDFGHTAPMTTLPIGVQCEINCDARTFSIIESGVS
ncbi:LD-carboxypeptidase [Eubacteriales bacterium OttesenSCG-928-A19]|nr:LD-carboxypeptidase [Eubacteriales bacterium OttesenSCG-928-A19]